MIKRKVSSLFFAIVMIMFFSTYAKGQVWCPPGATWYYQTNAQLGSGYSKYTYVNDTVIKGITCKKLTGFLKIVGPVGSIQKNLAPEFVYSENGVAYQYNDGKYLGRNKFDTIFNINAKIGDKWRLPRVDTLCPDSMYNMKVLNIGTKTINGFNLKWLYVKIGAINMGGTLNFYV
ncbi:MAG TPA: hypothetical protein VFF27_01080, partial [Bacteroidia bacterium]|nr:hypothetical protein [Bacteroidia bacterium]